MSETRKIAAILVSDVVGYSRLAGADEDRTLARLRALRSDLIDPTISVHHGRIVKRTGDGSVIEFRSVVDAVRCALEVQHAMVERNAGVAPDKRIEFRIGIHLGDVVEESDGDLMGDGVNIAARLEGVCEHPLQEAFLTAGALQCGYCTPGMIMSGYALLAKKGSPTSDEIRHAMEGNVCRCGTYVRIVKAVQMAADLMKGSPRPSRSRRPRRRAAAGARRPRKGPSRGLAAAP